MTANRRLRVVRGDSAHARKPEKSLPPANYSGEPSEEQLDRIRESVREEIESGNWKTVDGPAW